jgi:hypothetical protein
MMPAIGELAYIAIVAREPEAKVTTPMMMVAWVTGSILISKMNFISPRQKAGRKIAKRSWVGALVEGLFEKKEPRDSGNSESYGNGTSMDLGEGKKPSGEEVSFSVQLPLY